MNIGDSEAEARASFGDYIGKYYPELSQAMDLSQLGAGGDAGADRRVDPHLRRGRASTTSSAGSARIDQFGQVERFAPRSCPGSAPERVR